MSICQKCGAQLPQDSAFCPVCGCSVDAQPNNINYQPQQPVQPAQPYQQPTYQQAPNQTYQQAPNQTYQQAPNQAYQQPQYQPYNQNQPYAQQPMGQYGPQSEIAKLASSAKTMGILSLIFGFISPLLGWIFGGVAMSKSKKVTENTMFQPDMDTLNKAKSAKTMAIIGIVVSFLNVIVSFAILYMNN